MWLHVAQYGIEQCIKEYAIPDQIVEIKYQQGEPGCSVWFYNPETYTIFALTWDKYLDDADFFNRYLLRQFVIIE